MTFGTIYICDSLCFFVFLRKSRDFDRERHRTGSEDIYYSEIVKPNFKAELLEASGVPPSGNLRLGLAGGTRARDPPRRPDRRRRVRPAQLHCDHSVLATELDVDAVQRYLPKVQVAPDTEAAHHVIDDYVYLGRILLLRRLAADCRFSGLVSHFMVGSVVNWHRVSMHYARSRQCLHAVLLENRSHHHFSLGILKIKKRLLNNI